MTLALDPRAEAVLKFWFGSVNGTAKREAWFKKDPAFDAEIAEKFEGDYVRAHFGAYDAWQKLPQGALALVLLLDQFPRNMFRDDPRALPRTRKRWMWRSTRSHNGSTKKCRRRSARSSTCRMSTAKT